MNLYHYTSLEKLKQILLDGELKVSNFEQKKKINILLYGFQKMKFGNLLQLKWHKRKMGQLSG